MNEFVSFINEVGLYDCGFSGASFTWCNNLQSMSLMWQRIDRALVNVNWGDRFEKTEVEHATKIHSDHCPFIYRFSEIAALRRISYFKFLDMLTEHPGFPKLVEDNWTSSYSNNPIENVFLKLKYLKFHLKRWNKEVFGNVFDNIKAKERQLQQAEQKLEEDDSKSNVQDLNDAKMELDEVLRLEELYWR